jgi:hypothetical protein
MHTDIWIIEWRERGRGEEIVEMASTPREAVETIRRMLEGEIAFDESVEEERPAFELLFDGEEAATVLQRIDESIEQECDNGKLIVRRSFQPNKLGIKARSVTSEAAKSNNHTLRELVQRLKEDYLEWSGGFPPDSETEIFLYVEYARKIEDAEFAREALRAWNEQDNMCLPFIPMPPDIPITVATRS